MNTDEQVGLLEFVKSNCREVRDIPVCVIINKVDHGADEEVVEMVKEIEAKVAQIFGDNATVQDASANALVAPLGITTSSNFQSASNGPNRPTLTTVTSDKGSVQKLMRGGSSTSVGKGQAGRRFVVIREGRWRGFISLYEK